MQLDVRCPECKQSVRLSHSNTVLVIYENNLTMSFFRIVCEACQHEWFTFIDEDYHDCKEVIKLVLNEGWPVQPEQTPAKWVVENWEEQMGYDLIKPVEILPRHEEEIAKLAEVLQNTPDELLLDLFSQPPPKSGRPQDWR